MKKIRRTAFMTLTLAIVCILLFFTAACGGEDPDDTKKPVGEIEVESIEVIKAPKKVDYLKGETFDPTGMVLRATYTDGSREAVRDTEFTYAPDGALDLDDDKVTITYEGKTVEQSIMVRKSDGAILKRISVGASALRYPQSESIDLSGDISLTAQFSDAEGGNVITQELEEGYTLTFTPDGGGEAKTATDLSNVTGLTKGEYTCTASLSDGTAASGSFDITVYNGYTAEAEEIWDSETIVGAPAGYNINHKPDEIRNYTMIESIAGKNWTDTAKTGYARGEDYSGKRRYEVGAACCIRPENSNVPLANCSGGLYLGELSRMTIFSVHFYSEVEREVNIIMSAASAMTNNADNAATTVDAPMDKMFNIYTDATAYKAEEGTFDRSKKVDLSDVVLKGTESVEGGIGDADKFTYWQDVVLGKMTLKKGDNVIYFENVFNASDETWANCKNKWMMNIDCFSVEFVD